MTSDCSTARRIGCWLIPALALLAATAAPAAAVPWQLEPVGASEGVRELHDLSFDSQGRALLSWDAELLGNVPPVFGGLATRDPAGGWGRPPNLGGVDPASAQVHVLADQRTLLIAREGGPAAPGRRRLVAAAGGSDGGFGPLVTLAAFTARSWSAANAAGDTIVAWTNERTPFLAVRERTSAGNFGPRRDLALARSAAVAINDRGDRLLAWPDKRRIAVRVRSARGTWGETVRFGRLPADRDRRLSAIITPSGRMLITWGRDRGDCGVAVRDAGGSWHARRLQARCGPAAVGSREAPVAPARRGARRRRRGSRPRDSRHVGRRAVAARRDAADRDLRRAASRRRAVRRPAPVAHRSARRARQPRGVSSADRAGRRRDPVRPRAHDGGRGGRQPARRALAWIQCVTTSEEELM